MSDQGPGEYWGSDYLLQAQKLYERGDYKRGFSMAVRAIDTIPTSWLAYRPPGMSSDDQHGRYRSFDRVLPGRGLLPGGAPP